MPNLVSESKTPISSSKRKSVFLHQWWLIKVEKEPKLGVGGFVNRETFGTRGMRLFGSPSTNKRQNVNIIDDGVQVYGSAAIAKRHDNNTLESVDGIIIRISGCINKSRTLSYGFSPEVCDSFLSGFPCSWEDYASKSSHDRCDDDITKQSLPASFDDLRVTHVRHLLMSGTDSCALNSIIFGDIMKHTEKILNQSVPSVEKISRNSIETEADHNEDDVSLSNLTQKITGEDSKIAVDSHMIKSEEIEDGFMPDEIHNITYEKQSRILLRRYPLRSRRNRENT
ncbi:putative transcription regulator Others family [Helianthus annuus]|uniref:Transcription regulator Others family n=1 Tax=Helianthus annuus TaxID=4232 RepID=A0A9K3EFU8_HELAN|nr:protein EMBRYO DEFECTIVE 1674 [Helianthus annuus]XP_035837797.1 protein EMBRYO DEFECTIVE 1674 [Helianthus annuus]KAF5772503.1 putative transcription regulator Others family [Helianthus annuus]KAJ0480190.1 putative transcription regulator Others family [Helianthus annuus]KAJ0496925.1 putative transcription regulator Others family [Helianthus annuus]KAJ0857300.1 putative transcription regulator Others family [Helianthus annuus]